MLKAIRWGIAAAAGTVAVLASEGSAQPPRQLPLAPAPASEPDTAARPPRQNLTGEWRGWRERLRTSVGAGVVAGTEMETAVGGRLAQQVTTAALTLAPARSVRTYAELRAIAGVGVDHFPSHQGFSNLTAPRQAGPGEVWLEISPRQGPLRMKLGRTYATTEFASVATAVAFLNPAFGLSPALSAMPAYPDPARSGGLFLGEGRLGLEGGAEVARRADGGRMLLLQARRAPGDPAAWRASAGAILTSPNGSASRRHELYATLERPPDGDRAGLFILAARGHGPCGAPATHVALGAVLERPLQAGVRSAGLALSGYGDRGAGPAESVFEGFVRFRPAGWLYVQPDLQVILPLRDGGERRRARGLAALLRMGVRY